MEKDTEENTNSNDGESLLKEIESYFKQIRKTCPKKISEEIQTLYDQFITLTKGSEKDQIFEKLEILNTIVNNTSEALKSLNNIPKKTQKYLSELKKATYQLNTIKHISSCITKIYKTGKYLANGLLDNGINIRESKDEQDDITSFKEINKKYLVFCSEKNGLVIYTFNS